ncbi:helix-turn-helix transcriptional regulator [Dysgonomonas termitidis]
MRPIFAFVNRAGECKPYRVGKGMQGKPYTCPRAANTEKDKKDMEEQLLNELQKIRELTLLGIKKALTMTDASLLTGLSKSHLYKLVCAKKIPYYKSQGGKLTYFDRRELEAWMLSGRIKTSVELEQEAADFLVADR